MVIEGGKNSNCQIAKSKTRAPPTDVRHPGPNGPGTKPTIFSLSKTHNRFTYPFLLSKGRDRASL